MQFKTDYSKEKHNGDKDVLKSHVAGYIHSNIIEVIIHMSRGGVFLVEQDTIEYVRIFFIFFYFHFSADATIFKNKNTL